MRCSLRVAAIVLALSACDNGPEAVHVEFQPLWTEFPGSFEAGTYVFRSQIEMAAAWANAPQDHLPVDPTAPPGPVPMPDVDFALYSVVGVSLGVGIRCFAPHIKSVFAVGEDITVVYRVPPDTAPATLACRYRWPLTAFAKVAAIRGRVTFEAVSD